MFKEIRILDDSFGNIVITLINRVCVSLYYCSLSNIFVLFFLVFLSSFHFKHNLNQ
jgi:hypothetical protein